MNLSKSANSSNRPGKHGKVVKTKKLRSKRKQKLLCILLPRGTMNISSYQYSFVQPPNSFQSFVQIKTKLFLTTDVGAFFSIDSHWIRAPSDEKSERVPSTDWRGI